MNKRQRKKRITISRKKDARALPVYARDYTTWAYRHRNRGYPSADTWVSLHERNTDYRLLSHPRRRHLPTHEFYARKATILARDRAEKARLLAHLSDLFPE